MAILLITTRGNQQQVAHCCKRAAAAGIVPGMSLAHARALLPCDGVIVEEHNPARDALRLKSLASWAIRFTPVVAVDSPDGLLLDVTGCERLHRGERRLINTIGNSIEWLGFHTRIACASNFACARAVARYGGRTSSPSRDDGATNHNHRARERAGLREMNSTDLHDRSLTPTLPLSHSLPNERSSPAEGEGAGAHADRFIVRAGDELDALRNLPIEGLRLEQDTIDALHEVNIAHIGELTCLDRNDLAARFGRDLLLKLDRALGDQGGADEPIEPQRLIQAPRVERVFDGPVKQAEGIARTVQDLVAELCGVLLKIESGVRQLDIDFERIDAANLHEMIMLSRPSRDAKHLWSLLRPRVEKANLGYGVEKIVLKATRTGRLPHAQVERWTDDDANGAAIKQVAGELIDTLTNRLGSERITRAVLIESHLPERAFRHEPVAADTQRPTISNQQPMVDRPTVLLEKPELIEVMSLAPAGPPQWLRWRSQELAIITSSGPERIGEEWWREGAVLPSCQRREMFDAGVASSEARDYFRLLVDDGRWLWVYRQLGDGKWFVHGEWT